MVPTNEQLFELFQQQTDRVPEKLHPLYRKELADIVQKTRQRIERIIETREIVIEDEVKQDIERWVEETRKKIVYFRYCKHIKKNPREDKRKPLPFGKFINKIGQKISSTYLDLWRDIERRKLYPGTTVLYGKKTCQIEFIYPDCRIKLSDQTHPISSLSVDILIDSKATDGNQNDDFEDFEDLDSDDKSDQ